MEEKNVRPFGMKDKLGYMFGDFGNDFTFVLASMVLMKFYSDVMGVSTALIGGMMAVARIVDAFTDVTMGQIVDRSKPTENGKFKPWILRMSGPVAVASLLIYASWFKDMSMGFKVVWMFVTYILWGSVFYTSVNIPYGSMASAISADAKDRSELSTFRTIGSSLASMVIGVIIPIVVYDTDAFGNKIMNGTKVSVVAAICSVSAIACYILCHRMCTERVKVAQKTEKFSLIRLFQNMIHNKSLIGIVLASICMLLVQLTQSTMTTYLYPNYFRNTEAQSVAGVVGTLVVLVLAVFTSRLAAKIGKKELAVIGSVFGALVYAVAYVFQIQNAWMFVAFYAVSYIGLAFFQLTCWAMITDVIDDTEVQTGTRSDGEIYSVYSFARKLGQAASSAVSGVLLSAIGYSAATQFDPEVTQGIYDLSCLVPAVGFLLLALVLQFFYPLNKKKVEENVKFLVEKNKQS